MEPLFDNPTEFNYPKNEREYLTPSSDDLN
jgi:hypothetical protein